MSVLSIQSHVVTGRVGNAIVAFALQRLGIEVWPVHTVLFSNHPGQRDRFAAKDAHRKTCAILFSDWKNTGCFPVAGPCSADILVLSQPAMY